jgi:DNA polymerase-1
LAWPASSASSREEAQRYVELYFLRYPGVKAYMERTRAQAT